MATKASGAEAVTFSYVVGGPESPQMRRLNLLRWNLLSQKLPRKLLGVTRSYS